MYAQFFAYVCIPAANCRHNHSHTLSRVYHSVLHRVELIPTVSALLHCSNQDYHFAGKAPGKRIGHALQSIAHSQACRPPRFVRRDPVHLPLISLRQLLIPGMGLAQHILHKQNKLAQCNEVKLTLSVSNVP